MKRVKRWVVFITLIVSSALSVVRSLSSLQQHHFVFDVSETQSLAVLLCKPLGVKLLLSYRLSVIVVVPQFSFVRGCGVQLV